MQTGGRCGGPFFMPENCTKDLQNPHAEIIALFTVLDENISRR